MQKVELSYDDFMYLLKATRYSICRDGYRESLRYIKVSVLLDSMSAFSSDGEQASRATVPCKSNCSFTGFIRPITVPKLHPSSANERRTIVISVDDEHTYLTVDTDYGDIRYSFPVNLDYPEEVERVFNEAAKDAQVVQAFNAGKWGIISQQFSPSYRGYFRIHEPKDKFKPMYLCSTDCYSNGRKIEQIILPVRGA